jgi:hypothetical protein
MDLPSKNLLSSLVRNSRVAALGTLHDGAPFVSMVLAAPDPKHTAWFLHLSRLSGHTQDLLKDPRASLMLAQADTGETDPQQLARLTLVGKAAELSDGSAEEDSAKAVYLAKFPEMAEIVDQLGDFSFWAIRPASARFVGGFARAFTLDAAALRKEIAAGAGA